MPSIFPPDFKYLEASDYLRLPKIPEGEEVRVRVLGTGIGGLEDWKEGDDGKNMPVRYREREKPVPFNQAKPIKKFLAVVVWNYDLEMIQILSITQASVIKTLRGFEEKKGDLTDYDLRMIRTGAGKLSKYTILTGNNSEIPAEAKEALKHRPVDLEAMYEGKDPFQVSDRSQGQIKPNLGDLAKLMADNIKDMPAPEMLKDYLEFCQPKIPKPMEEAAAQWIEKPQAFLVSYKKWLEARLLKK